MQEFFWHSLNFFHSNFSKRPAKASSSPSSTTERTRTLIVNRDEQSGFGLTLSGDRPVSVQTVRSGGAADRSGIREKDVIVKVNGTHVTQSTHTEVVDLIAGKQTLNFHAKIIFLKINFIFDEKILKVVFGRNVAEVL